jgi:hypothetical protein
MRLDPAPWLLATALFPLLGATGALAGVLSGRTAWMRASVRVGLAGASLCGAVLTALLMNGSEWSSIRLPVWTWFFIAAPQPLSIVFGLEATPFKSGFVSLAGALIFSGLWKAGARDHRPLTDDTELTLGLFHAAVTIFVLAPNLAQALMSWGAISLLTGVLLQLLRERSNSFQPARASESGSSLDSRRTSTEILPVRLIHFLNTVARGIADFERVWLMEAWRAVTVRLPNWLGEQAELIENSPVSFQLLATIFGASSVLLTWLVAD